MPIHSSPENVTKMASHKLLRDKNGARKKHAKMTKKFMGRIPMRGINRLEHTHHHALK